MARARLFNLRLPLTAALALSCGAALAYLFAVYSWSYFYLLAIIPAAALALIFVLLFSRGRAVIVNFVVAAVFFALGAVYAAAVFSSYSDISFSGQLATVTGRVEEVSYTSSGDPYLILSNASADGVSLNRKVLVYLSQSAGGAVSPGYTVTVFGYVGHYDLFSYGSLNYRALNGIGYYVNAYGSMEYSYGFSFFGALRVGVRDILFDNLDSEAAAVAYAMITGDTGDIAQSTLDSFRYGGVAHIFAVSGLNITVLYVLVTAIFKKCRVNRWVGAAVSLTVIFVYTGMCSFTLSAVRAAIMCAVSGIAAMTFNKYDGLNSLSLSVVIILLFNPLNLFDVGFVLSVSAMLGIILLSPGIARLLRRLPYSLQSNISMSLASQVATMPALLMTFGYISGAGLILNIVVLPLLSFLYVFMFACVVVCAIIPAAAVLLPYASLPLQAVIDFFVAFGFEDSLISGFGGWWVAIIVFIAILALSDKLNFAKSLRAAVGGVCALVFALCCTFGGAVFGNETRIVAGGYYNGGMVAVRSQSGSVLIIICDTYSGGITSFVNTYMPEGVDDLIIIGGEECAAYYYQCGITAENVWLPPSNINLSGLDGTTVHYETTFELYGTQYSFVDSYTLSATANGVSFAVCAGSYVNIDFIDLLFSLQSNNTCQANTVVYFNDTSGDFDLYSHGSLQFVANSGTLVLLYYVG